MQFWNSYDGSKSFGYSLMLFRLVCTNGIMSKDFFDRYKFKHEPQSENWDENLDKVVSNINSVAIPGRPLDKLVSNLRKLKETQVDIEKLSQIRHQYLPDIPVGLWGQIIDKYTSKKVDYNGWELLNAGTDILWHKDKPTMASYGQNQEIVDGLCRAVA